MPSTEDYPGPGTYHGEHYHSMNHRAVLGHIDPEERRKRIAYSPSKGYGGWTHNSVTGRYFLNEGRTNVEFEEKLNSHISRIVNTHRNRQHMQGINNVKPEEGEYESQGGNNLVRISSNPHREYEIE
jgi:hypothetical protein